MKYDDLEHSGRRYWHEEPKPSRAWRLVDAFTAALLCVLLALIIFPGLRMALKELVQKVVA